MAPDGADELAAVIVNYNVRDHLLACVRSLRDEGVRDVVVVDNDSIDGSGPALAAADPDARFIPAGANLGFGRAANRGVAATAASLVLILNPDAVVEPGSVKTLLAALDEDEGLAVVGPRVDNPDGTRYPSVRRFPDLGMAAGHAFLGLVRPGNRFTRRYRMLDREPNRAGPVDWVSGTCMLVRRPAFDAVGGFDEAYFMYVEDVDLCTRLRRRGWTVLFSPELEVVHQIGVSTKGQRGPMAFEHSRSIQRYYEKFHARGGGALLVPFVRAALWLRAALVSTLDRRRGR
ncbi:MAG TPA: glycosyltransferase family 2 protein [Acidimicrobiales bacterium]|nr:glycosyltransferase family 2 protein [Acidimicrobiales bacterium]